MRHLQHCHWLHFVLQLPLVMGLSLDRDTIPSSLEKTMFFSPASRYQSDSFLIRSGTAYLIPPLSAWYPIHFVPVHDLVHADTVSVNSYMNSIVSKTPFPLSAITCRHYDRSALLFPHPWTEDTVLPFRTECSKASHSLHIARPCIVLSIPIYWKNKLHWWRLAKVLIYG